MNEPKYTSGPWFVDVCGDTVFEVVTNGSAIAKTYSPATGDEGANAQLIASAPELAEALEELLDLVDAPAHRPSRVQAIEQARAALEKAGLR